MELKQIRSILKMFEDSSVHELEVQSGEDRVRLVRSPPLTQAPVATSAIAPAPAAAAADDGGGNGVEAAPAVPEGHLICSPFVGTFYRAPSPGSAPFVDVGAMVQPGSVLCIVEAMKLMNEIEAEVAGRVVEILVENGQPVEFDHPLFRVVPV